MPTLDGQARDQLMWVRREILVIIIMSKRKRGHTHKDSQRLSKSWSFLDNTNTKSLTTFGFL